MTAIGIDPSKSGREFSPVAQCAYCNRPATRFHAAPLIHGRAMASIPLCGTACGSKLTRKGRGK